VAGYIPTMFNHQQTVTHPSINRARRRVNTSIETNALQLTHYSSSSSCWCTDVSMEHLHCTRRKVAHKHPTSSVVNICGPPVSGRWSFRSIDWTVLVVGVLLLRARRPGIRCQTVFVTQLW